MFKSAIFGGSFDPPHLGHLFVVTTLLNMGFDEVRIIPVASHPLSKKCLPFSLRFQMAKLNFGLFPERVVVDDIENKLPAPSRTWDTIIQLEKMHPDSNFTLIIGEDNLAIKNNWYKWQEITAKIDVLTIGRGNFDSSNPQLKIPDISSSFIRKNINYHNRIKDLLNPKVFKFIQNNNLYSRENPPDLKWALIGKGKIGTALIHNLKQKHQLPLYIIDPLIKQNRLQLTIPQYESIATLPQNKYSPDIIVFATPDNLDLTTELELLADKHTYTPFLVHTGGMKSPEQRFPNWPNAKTGLLHPLKSVSTSKTNLFDSFWGISTLNNNSKILKNFLDLLEGKTVDIPEGKEALYHCGCSLAANGTAINLAKTKDLFYKHLDLSKNNSEGITMQLANSALANLNNSGIIKGLTGPLVRRDWQTINYHLKALKKYSPETIQIYLNMLLSFSNLLNIDLPKSIKNLFK
ncbi:MAG: DUF2520 domain-containing protein [Myxococcota bacterium]